MILGNSTTELMEYPNWHALSANDRKANENSLNNEKCISPNKVLKMGVAKLATLAAQ